MNSSSTRWLHRVANTGLVLAFVLGICPLGMRAYGNWSQQKARERFTSEFSAHAAPSRPRSAAEEPVMLPAAPASPRRAWETSILQIPSIGVDAVVSEGAGQWELTIGPGHLPETAGPGGAGNCAIGAHRNMWDAAFAKLPQLKRGDMVYVITSSDRYAYQIDSSREVQTRDKSPLARTRNARLTLITCVLPFNKERRWVAQGHLVHD